MSEITVEQLAKTVGTSGEELVKKLQSAGIPIEKVTDIINDQQRLILLKHLRQSSSTITTTTLSLGKRNDELKATNNAHSSKKATVITATVRRKKKRASPSVHNEDTDAKQAQPPAATNEYEMNRSEALTKQLKAERIARENFGKKPLPTQQTNPQSSKTSHSGAEKSTKPTPQVDQKAKSEAVNTKQTPQQTAKIAATKAMPEKAKTTPNVTDQPTPVKEEIAVKPTNTPPSKPTPVEEVKKTEKVDIKASFAAARRQRDSVAAAAREEAASILKRRPSRKVIKKTVVAPKSAATGTQDNPKKSDTPQATKPATPVVKKKKFFTRPDAKPASANSYKGRRKNKKHTRHRESQIKIEKSLDHAFEKPTAPVIHEIEIPESIVVSDLAKMLSIKSSEIIMALMKMGVMVTINQTIDQDTAILITEELGHKAAPVSNDDEQVMTQALDSSDEYDAIERPPVVTIMGHVDHGKTSLLDYIRHSRVASGEAGGITQHIGAYSVKTDSGIIAFLDTPGHAAFSTMRARGAKTTDIIILVIAADDGVMPQTIEAIKHARASNVALIVAINKIDRENADPERVKKELTAHEVIPEEWGGEDVFVPISAKTGEGIDALLEAIHLVAEMQELKAPIDCPAAGSVIESSIEKGRGAVATILIKKGTLRQGDMVLCGMEYGRIRAMLDDLGKPIKEATPSIPVSILGLSGAPGAGDDMICVSDEKKAREIADMRRAKEREQRLATQQAAKLESLINNMGKGEIQYVNILLKADVQGSVGAIRDSLTKLSTDEVQVKIVSSGVGGINESDTTLAHASNAIIIGFNVRADDTARRSISEIGLDLRYYSIIYQVIDDVRAAMNGMLSPELREEFIGLAEVKDVFRSSALGAVAGCLITEGSVRKGSPIRVLRNDIVIYEGDLESLRRHKDDVSEVRMGTECGIAVKNYNDVKAGDRIECFERTEVARTI